MTYLPADAFLSALGLGKTFPFTNGSAVDLVINGADQTVAPSGGVLRYRSITFTTAHVLRITSSPCILMVDTITWNAAGVIACEASGAPALGANPAENFPRGGRMIDVGDAIGGYGGGFLIVLAGVVNGSTTGTIRANGTGANRNTGNAGAIDARGGEGALSTRISYFGWGKWYAEQWGNATTAYASVSVTEKFTPSLPPAHMCLANGGDNAVSGGNAGSGGGSGGTNGVTSAGGGSGFGGGGGLGGAAPAVPTALVSPNLGQILALMQLGVRGGGGGAAGVHTAGANNSAAGGGGGCVVLIVDTETQVSTLTAAGGAAVGPNCVAGGAGVTLRQVV